MHQITYNEAILAMEEGHILHRIGWGECRIIRTHKISDYDFINVDSLSGFIIEDCKQKVCDCSVGVYQPTAEDKEATDWEIINN
jgi:hypothetical protein